MKKLMSRVVLILFILISCGIVFYDVIVKKDTIKNNNGLSNSVNSSVDSFTGNVQNENPDTKVSGLSDGFNITMNDYPISHIILVDGTEKIFTTELKQYKKDDVECIDYFNLQTKKTETLCDKIFVIETLNPNK